MEDSRICKLCGSEFTPMGRNASRQKYCTRDHCKKCEVCGTEFLITKSHIQSGSIPKCCSRKCSNKLKIENSKKTMKSKYGTEYVSRCPQFKEKISERIKLKSHQITESRRRTMLERYGVEHPIQNESIKHKIDQTNLAKYGVKNVAQNHDVRTKISQTLKQPEIQAKRISTNLDRYGVEYASQSQLVKDKMIETNLERYGCRYSIQDNDVKRKATYNQMLVRMNDSSIALRSKQATNATCKDKYGIDWPCQLPQCKQASNGRSNVNKEFYSILASHNIKFTEEFSLGKYSYDALLIDTNILIEINPTYTHNSVGNHWGNGVDMNYHLSKTQTAHRNGYRCIHIWDWDNIDSILNMLRPKIKIHARKCRLTNISNNEADVFLKHNHIQGTCKGQKVCYGLYYEDELVQVMTFGKPRYSSKYHWELLRLASKVGVSITGGASKLFNAFLKSHSPKTIISYCDLSKFDGRVYEKIGMTLHHTSPPAKMWSKGQVKITDNLLRQRGFDQLFGTAYGKGTSNEQLMIEHKWLPVYDCGQAVYVYSRSECKNSL